MYQSSYQAGDVSETKSKMEDMTRQVVAERLSGSRIICEYREEPTSKNKNQYKFYITVELAKYDILKGIADKMKQEQMLRTDADYENFKKIYDQEMSKSSNQ